ncbi:hypothetical protein Y032_0323g2505 [Ancylostoma ceylanicum]|uniref:Uncharacterized protein n=1 Tax=Ancylostoma ceylanicum TaxID=53326 RepID=A0A016S0H8_9BILA|nr:hypothetical protein Y032_0323g2505 [Ancylostoma ceylanicum]
MSRISSVSLSSSANAASSSWKIWLQEIRVGSSTTPICSLALLNIDHIWTVKQFLSYLISTATDFRIWSKAVLRTIYARKSNSTSS